MSFMWSQITDNSTVLKKLAHTKNKGHIKVWEWITAAPVDSSQNPSLIFSLLLPWTRWWTNSLIEGDLIRHCAHMTYSLVHNIMYTNDWITHTALGLWSTRTQDISYPRQLVPKTTRTQDISYRRQLVPKTTSTQDNSYPGQLVPSQGDSYPRQLIPKTTRTQTQGNSCSKRLEPKTNRSQNKSLPKQLVFFRLVQKYLKYVKKLPYSFDIFLNKMHFF